MRSESRLLKPHLRKTYPCVERGEGIYLYDTGGRRYLDGCSGAVAANIGHGVPEIAAAMQRQAERISFAYRAQFTNAAAEELADRLVARAPGDLGYVFFVNSGSEAIETALKIALQYWDECGVRGKRRFLARQSSYHGITLGALSASGHTARRKLFEDLLEPWADIPPPYCYRCPWNRSYPSCELACASALEQRFITGADSLAAFLAEPITGAAGAAITPPAGYYERVNELCRRHKVLHIADEVMTGIGRCGKFFAFEHWDGVPDIVVLGKGLSGGYTPIGAVLVSSKVIDVIRNGSGVIMAGHTFSGNPQSAAVALAVLNYIDQHDLVRRAADNGGLLQAKLNALKEKYAVIADVRGKGLLLGMEFVRDQGSKSSFFPEQDFAAALIEAGMRNGLMLYHASGAYADNSGIQPSAILIAPPLTITPEEIDELVALFERTLGDVLAAQ